MSSKARRRPSWKKHHVKFPHEYHQLMNGLRDALAMSKRMNCPVDVLTGQSDVFLRVTYHQTADGNEWLQILQEDA